MSKPDTITIDDIKYIRADSVQPQKPVGNRHVVVVDRGWIFAGDLERKDGRIKLTQALHVFKWESVGFAGMLENTKKADLRKISDVDIPEDAEIFCIPVNPSWGL